MYGTDFYRMSAFRAALPLHKLYIRIVHQYRPFFLARALMHSNINNIGGGRAAKKRRTLRDFTRITW